MYLYLIFKLYYSYCKEKLLCGYEEKIYLINILKAYHGKINLYIKRKNSRNIFIKIYMSKDIYEY